MDAGRTLDVQVRQEPDVTNACRKCYLVYPSRMGDIYASLVFYNIF
jgi:hypothetical protein